MAATADLTRGPVLLALSITTAGLAFSTCGVRFCVRSRISNDVGLDDYAIGVATVVGFIGTIFSIVESASMAESSARALEFDSLGQPWFLMGATLAKISICLFFIRLVGSIRMWRILLMTQIFLMAVVNLTFALMTNLQCRPLEKFWRPTVNGECWNPSVQLNMGYFRGAFSIFSWLFLSLFPVMIVRDLEMHRAMRWPFYFLSSLSLVAGIFATTRTYQISQIPSQSGIFTFANFIATVLAIVEQNVGIVAANVLPMGPLFSRHQRQLSRANNGFRKGLIDGNSSRSTRSVRSGRSHYHPHRRLPSADGSLAQLKSSSSATLVIEGPRRESFELSTTSLSAPPPSRTRDRERERGGFLPSRSGSSRSNRNSMVDAADAWPKGIIKTVEVEVVEENITDFDRANMISRASSIVPENDWDRMLRNGPSRTGFS